MTNPTGIIPLEYHLLVLPDPIEDTITAPGGTKFILPDDSEKTRRKQAKQERATVVITAKNCFEGWAIVPQVGSKVMINQYAGEFCKGSDGVEYRLIRDEEIKAMIES